MYEGINGNDGIFVEDNKAFSYACRLCMDDKLLAGGFMEMARETNNFDEFALRFEEWAFSGDWIHHDDVTEEDHGEDF